MKNIWKVFMHDLKKINGNAAAIIVVITLALLPSFYAWFNILASWDPYDNTGNLKVAVVNEDVGSEFDGKTYQIGDQVVETLKKNKDLDWQFVDGPTAESGVTNGEYYASILFPKEFSKDLLSLSSDKVSQAKIVYTYNDKINAIAPKITTEGASTLQQQIDQMVIGTISQVLLEEAKKIGLDLSDELPKTTQAKEFLETALSKYGEIEEAINSGEQTIGEVEPLLLEVQKQLPAIETIVGDAINFTSSVESFTNSLINSFNKIGPQITNDLKLIQQIANSISSQLSEIQVALKDPDLALENAKVMQALKGQVDTAQSFVTSLNEFLRQLSTQTDNQDLQTAINKLISLDTQLVSLDSTLVNAISSLANCNGLSQAQIDSLINNAINTASIAADAATFAPTVVMNAITNINNELKTITTSIDDELVILQSQLPELKTALASALETLELADTTIIDIKELLPEAKVLIEETIGIIEKVEQSGAFVLIEKILGLNIEDDLKFIEQPVVIDTKRLFPIANYGSAMTPFYTILALWVGCLLLSSIFKVTTELKDEVKPYQAYFGKYLLFASIALIQAIVVSAGDIWLLKVQVLNIPMFFAVAMFSSLIFSFFIFTVVHLFGDAGKVIGIILLVLQVAGSGGTYPVQLTPDFFQVIYPFLPFTYAIAAMRECVGGVVWALLIKDLLIMSLYLVFTFGLYFIFKKPFGGIVESFTKQIEDTGLIN